MSLKHLDIPLSNFDLIHTIAKDMKERANIVDTRQINKYNNLEQLFQGRGHAILYEPSEDPKSDIGHWTCLVRQRKSPLSDNGSVIYWDSYGGKLKNDKIRNILKKKYQMIQFNPKRFQKYSSNPCGRYVLLCVALNKLKPDLTAKDIEDFLKLKPKKKSYDDYVIQLTKDIQLSPI